MKRSPRCARSSNGSKTDAAHLPLAHAVSLTCTDVRGILPWNGAATGWDCPYRGSRFPTGGAVLNGPAMRPLERVPVDPQR